MSSTVTTSPTSRAADVVLCVDDEQRVLDGLNRSLHGRFHLLTCNDPVEALELAADEPNRFAVVMSDLRMPDLDGVTFLSRMRSIAPDAVRVLLTGYADVDAATSAINEGNIFRFLTKPIDRETMVSVLDDAITQHRLAIAERELLEQTVHGAIGALVDALSLANPRAFARAHRIARTVSQLAQALDIDDWTIDVGARLAYLGAVTAPADLLDRLENATELDESDEAALARIAVVGDELLANIPRLEPVRAIVRHQHLRFDGAGTPTGRPQGDAIPLGARLIKLAADVDLYESRGADSRHIAAQLRHDAGRYDPNILGVYLKSPNTPRPDVIEVEIGQLEAGMVTQADILDVNGALLLGRGREITPNLRSVLVKHYLRGRVTGQVPVIAST